MTRAAEAFALLAQGNSLYLQREPAEALAYFDAACALEPAFAVAHVNAAQALMLLQRWGEAWARYEWRWRSAENWLIARAWADQLWSGREPIAGKAIMVHCEQGFGDSIQYCRHLNDLAARGARVYVDAPHELSRLLRSLACVPQIVERWDFGAARPAVDWHIPMLNLPRALGITEPERPPHIRKPYLSATYSDISKWAQRFVAHDRPRFGLCWSGNPTHIRDDSRSLPLGALRAALAGLDADLICLQPKVSEADEAAARDLTHWPLADFADTSALLMQLDVVVTVDTAVAHLAGALGVPVWILVSWVPDARWGLDGAVTWHYPCATLFRQQAAGDWIAPLNDVRAEALRMLEARQRVLRPGGHLAP
jgi:hypothetical protein